MLYAYLVDLISSINNKVNSNRHAYRPTPAQFVEILSEKAFFQTLNINGSNLPCGPLMMYENTETHQKHNMAGFLQNKPNELVYFDEISHVGFPAGLKYINDKP